MARLLSDNPNEVGQRRHFPPKTSTPPNHSPNSSNEVTSTTSPDWPSTTRQATGIWTSTPFASTRCTCSTTGNCRRRARTPSSAQPSSFSLWRWRCPGARHASPASDAPTSSRWSPASRRSSDSSKKWARSSTARSPCCATARVCASLRSGEDPDRRHRLRPHADPCGRGQGPKGPVRRDAQTTA